MFFFGSFYFVFLVVFILFFFYLGACYLFCVLVVFWDEESFLAMLVLQFLCLAKTWVFILTNVTVGASTRWAYIGCYAHHWIPLIAFVVICTCKFIGTVTKCRLRDLFCFFWWLTGRWWKCSVYSVFCRIHRVTNYRENQTKHDPGDKQILCYMSHNAKLKKGCLFGKNINNLYNYNIEKWYIECRFQKF